MKELGYIQESKHVLVGKIRRMLPRKLTNKNYEDVVKEFNTKLDKLLYLIRK